MRHAVALVIAGVVAASASAGVQAPAPKLILPYDLQASGNTVYVADGLRHQILRYDLGTRRLTVHAGTGRPGTSGDGGPATRARLTEPTELVLDRAGNLYFSDVNQGRVRRIDRRGIITTVARVPAAAGVAVDPTGRYLAIASIEGWVYRVELRDRREAAAGRRRHGAVRRRRRSRGRRPAERPARRHLRRSGQPADRGTRARAPHRRADGEDRDGVLPPGVQGRPRPARHVLPAHGQPERRQDHAGERTRRRLEGDRHRQALAARRPGRRSAASVSSRATSSRSTAACSSLRPGRSRQLRRLAAGSSTLTTLIRG